MPNLWVLIYDTHSGVNPLEDIIVYEHESCALNAFCDIINCASSVILNEDDIREGLDKADVFSVDYHHDLPEQDNVTHTLSIRKFGPDDIN